MLRVCALFVRHVVRESSSSSNNNNNNNNNKMEQAGWHGLSLAGKVSLSDEAFHHVRTEQVDATVHTGLHAKLPKRQSDVFFDDGWLGSQRQLLGHYNFISHGLCEQTKGVKNINNKKS